MSPWSVQLVRPGLSSFMSRDPLELLIALWGVGRTRKGGQGSKCSRVEIVKMFRTLKDWVVKWSGRVIPGCVLVRQPALAFTRKPWACVTQLVKAEQWKHPHSFQLLRCVNYRQSGKIYVLSVSFSSFVSFRWPPRRVYLKRKLFKHKLW